MGEWRVKRVYERGSTPAWYAKVVDPDGRETQRRLGPSWHKRTPPPDGYLTRRSARRAAEELLDELAGHYIVRAKVGGVTFEDACREWLRYIEHERGRTASTLRAYRNDVEGVFLPKLGRTTPLADIEPEDIEDLKMGLVRKGLAARTINKYLVELHGIFKRAQRAYGLPANPVEPVERMPQRRSNRISYLTIEEVEAVVRSIRDAPGYSAEQDSALIVTAAMTGLRWNELRQLRWADVDFEQALVHVRHQTKSHLVRSVPMIDRVAAVLDQLSQRERWTGDSDLVFVTEVGGPIDHSKQTAAYRKARDAAGVEGVRFHDLRHTFGTHAVRTNPVTDVKEWLGHADIATTMIYVHYVPQHEAARRLGAAFAPASIEPVEDDAGR